MRKIVIEGGKSLKGEVVISGAKNSVFMVGHVLIRKIKAHRQRKTEKQEHKENH